MRTSEMPVPTPISATIRRRIFGVGLISSSAIPVGQSNSEGLRAVNSNGIEELIHSNEIMAIFEVFYQPGKLFASLENRRAAWVVPLILGVLLLLGTTVAAVRLIGMETIIRQQLQNTRLSPEQMQTALSQANTPCRLYVTYAATVVVGAVSLMVITGLLTLFAMVGSKQPKFGTNFSMVALASFPYRLVVCLMSVLVLLAAPDRSALDINNLLATNVGAFMDKD